MKEITEQDDLNKFVFPVPKKNGKVWKYKRYCKSCGCVYTASSRYSRVCYNCFGGIHKKQYVLFVNEQLRNGVEPITG